MAKEAVIATSCRCTILCLPVARALVWTLRQEKWVCERVSFITDDS